MYINQTHGAGIITLTRKYYGIGAMQLKSEFVKKA